MDSDNVKWINTIRDTTVSYRRMIDATIEQLTDDELFARPSPEVNSVAIILRHLGGNLFSRWTAFLTTDGEKPERNRESEFQDWAGDRASLMLHFESGWHALEGAIDSLTEENIDNCISIRGESHSIPQALIRSITHITYHVGQIAIVARQVHRGDWNWLTVAPGASSQFNEKTWGTKASRSIFAGDEDTR